MFKRIVGFFRTSIRKKLVLFFLLIGLLPMLLSGIIMMNITNKEILLKEEQSMQSLAIATADSIDGWLETRFSELQLAAKTEQLRSNDPKRQLAILKELKSQSDSYETAVFTDKTGIVRAHTTEENINVMNLGDRDYFLKGMQGEVSTSQIIVSRTTGNRIIVMATPVYGEDEKIIGVLSATINFEDLVNRFLTDASVQVKGMFPVLVDAEHMIQVFNNDEYIGKPVEELNYDSAGKKLLASNENAGFAQIMYDDEEYLVAHAPIEIAGFGLFLHMPMSLILSATDKLETVALILTCIIAIIIFIIAEIIAKFLSRPIVNVTEKITVLASGDLTVEDIQLDAKDEIGKLTDGINKMKHSLRKIINEVNESSNFVASSADELAHNVEENSKAAEQITIAMQGITSGVDEEHLRVKESVRAIEDMSISIEEIDRSASQINEASQETIKISSKGEQYVLKTVEQMNTIESSVQMSDNAIRSLEQQSQEIGDIIEVITGIAEQTNLLALNAAIESARAGEHGKGFAIVAEEVRKLAEQSRDSSSKIAKLIGDIQDNMDRSIKSMDQVKNEVQDGVKVVIETKEKFKEITAATNEISTQIEQLVSSSNKMVELIQKVKNSVMTISSISENNSASVQEIAASQEEQLAALEEITSASESLNSVTRDLQKLVQQFKV